MRRHLVCLFSFLWTRFLIHSFPGLQQQQSACEVLTTGFEKGGNHAGRVLRYLALLMALLIPSVSSAENVIWSNPVNVSTSGGTIRRCLRGRGPCRALVP